ncbi:MAG: hypothetical protein BVN28_03580, partial [Nitrospira sp. ST-bin4]
ELGSQSPRARHHGGHGDRLFLFPLPAAARVYHRRGCHRTRHHVPEDRAVLQIPLALTMVLAGSLRGAGDTRFIMGATTVGMWGVRVPMALIVALWLHLSVYYVWMAMIA